MQQLSLFPPQADITYLTGQSSLHDDTPSSPGELTTPEASLTERKRARRLDQFYTRRDVAAALMDWYRVKRIEHNLCRFQHTRIIEPSAGTGAFLRKLPFGSVGYDLDPNAPGVLRGDFLTTPLPADEPLVIIGNPPFGKNASMAVKFFNHAAQAASVIAFIVPLTFQKVSVQNRLDLSFHLLDEIPVPKDAFIFEGKRKHVPSVFQIWVRKDGRRQKVVSSIAHADFEFLPPGQTNKADFAIQRVGANAGMVHRNFHLSSNSHYFIKAAPGISDVLSVFRSLNLKGVAARTAGQPSLAKSELVAAYSRARRSSRAEMPSISPSSRRSQK